MADRPTSLRQLFAVGQEYTRQGIYELLAVPEAERRGNWETGYHQYKDTFFVFCNVQSAGRSGRDYGNDFAGDELMWLSKTGSNMSQPQIKRLLEPEREVLIFFRRENRQPFTFNGRGVPTDVEQGSDTVKVRWLFIAPDESHPERPAEELLPSQTYPEGAVQKILVNRYERNPAARLMCIAHHGCRCVVCNFDFEKFYGELGKGFIHVHHVRALADLPGGYEVNPITDLIPVCANCHAMLHKLAPPLGVHELQERLSIN